MSETVSVGTIKRNAGGRFAPGTVRGPGNPVARRVHDLKQAVLNCTTEAQVKSVLRKLHGMALEGDVQAAHEWLDRVLGKAKEHTQIDLNMTADPAADLAEFRLEVQRLRELEQTPSPN